MSTSRSLPAWFNALITVSLLLSFAPAPARADVGPDPDGISLSTAVTQSTLLDRAATSNWAILSSPSRDAPLMANHDSGLTVLPAWWSVTSDVSGDEYNSAPASETSSPLQIMPTPTPLPEVLPTSTPPSKVPPIPMPPPHEEDDGLVTQKTGGRGETSKYNTGFTALGRGYSLAGMTASYYDGWWFSGGLAATEIVTTSIDFHRTCFPADGDCDAETGGECKGCKLHDELADGDNYSVQWTGWLIAPTGGLYTFTISEADDAARMYLDGSLLIKAGQWNGELSWENITTTSRLLESGAHWVDLQFNQFIRHATVGITVAADSTATLEATLWGTGDWRNGTDWDGAGTINNGTTSLWSDPAFVDPDAGDYHITSTSAAIDAGVNASVTVDIDGGTYLACREMLVREAGCLWASPAEMEVRRSHAVVRPCNLG